MIKNIIQKYILAYNAYLKKLKVYLKRNVHGLNIIKLDP